jgi:microcystin-dependent protein
MPDITKGTTFTSGQTVTAALMNTLVDDATINDNAIDADKLAANAVTNAKVSGSAAIAHSKLANLGAAGELLVGNDDKVLTSVALSGDVTVDSAGEVTIGAGKVTQAMLNSDVLFMPAGAITQYGGASSPTGWLLCDGSAVSRTTYADLFTAISTTYGVGDGATTFNVPDLQGNVPVGKDSSTFSTLGDTGGAETHSLSEGELPAHKHIAPNKDCADYSTVYGTTTATVNTYCDTNGISSTDAPYTSSVGSGTAHTNLQPWISLNYIVKT